MNRRGRRTKKQIQIDSNETNVIEKTVEPNELEIVQAETPGIPETIDKILNKSSFPITVKDIQLMTVIQLHALIRKYFPEHDELLDIFNRDILQQRFMQKLGLIK